MINNLSLLKWVSEIQAIAVTKKQLDRIYELVIAQIQTQFD